MKTPIVSTPQFNPDFENLLLHWIAGILHAVGKTES